MVLGKRRDGQDFADFCAVYGLPGELTPLERLYLDLNVERARQLQVHTHVEGARVAAGAVAADVYYERWDNAHHLKQQAVLDAFFNRRR